jgi:hypothetical protein
MLCMSIVQRWILHTLQLALLISGGKEDAGNGNFFRLLHFTPVSCSRISFRDVAAGIAILREAGGLITTANPPANPETDPIEEVRLGSRLYLAIRPAGDSEGETGRQAQERVVRETWKRVRALDYSRPGA